MRGVLIAPLVKRYGNEVLCDLVEVGLQGQIHIGLASTIPEEAEKITEWNVTLNVMNRNVVKPPSGALADAYWAARIEKFFSCTRYL